MVVLSQVISDAAVAIRISSTTLAVVTLFSAVGAGIAFGVIVGRAASLAQEEIVLRSDISVAINRLITSSEFQELYNPTSTLNDFTNGLNTQLKLSFPQTSLKVVISSFSGEPVLVSSLSQRRKKQLGNRASIVTVNGSAYFTHYYASSQLLTGFSTYTQAIVLVDIPGKPSAALGTLSSKYSVFTDTYRTNLTTDQVDALQSINSNSTSNATIWPSG
jgi:hypothetical protein